MAAQRWGINGFVRANLWIIVALTLVYCVFPKAAASQLILSFASPLGAAALIIFMLVLGDILHHLHLIAWGMMIAPQLLFMLMGCLLWLAFRRTS